VSQPAFPLPVVLQVVLTDANVLFSRVLRDYILYAAREGLIAVAWSQQVLDDMAEHMMEKIHGFDQSAADALVKALNKTFPYALREPGPEHFAEFAGDVLPDEDDRAVMAAAIAAEATVICTNNIKHFPKAVMDKHGLTAMTADALLSRLIEERPAEMVRVHRVSVSTLAGATD
jgi:predicted nucleic acid-binding protein